MIDFDATGIAEAVRTGRLKAVDVTAAALDRAAASQEHLNAFTLIDRDGGLARAARIDELIRDGRDPGPLAGVPMGLKDLIDQAGLPTTNGSGFPPEVPERSATVVRSLDAAGAVIIGRTGLHEWAFGFTSENEFHGPVRNPWDPSESAGGSSGGSGAAVAARITHAAVGTDTGGSVRVPAALCGVFGLKVTHGRIPLTGVTPLAPSLDTVGPITATVRDLSAVYGAMVSYDPNDAWSRDMPAADGPRLRMPPTIGVVRQWMKAGAVTRHVSETVEQFCSDAEAAGFTIVEVNEPVLAPHASVSRAAGPEILRVHRHRLQRHPELYSDETRLRLAHAREATAGDLLDALAWAHAAGNRLHHLHRSGIDVFACPTVGSMHKPIGSSDMEIDGEVVFHRQALATFTAPINRIGLPAIAAPITASGTPPVSVQLIGIHWAESAILEAAAILQDADVVGSPVPPLVHSATRGGNRWDAPPAQ